MTQKLADVSKQPKSLLFKRYLSYYSINMSNTTKKEQRTERKDFLMHFYENRVKSYKDWPFMADSNCPPEKMAEAGFFHCPTNVEPDLVKCFVCLKELDGWDPTDNPWKEHKSHSAKCEFLKLKDPRDPTVEELVKTECERQLSQMNKLMAQKITNLEDYAKNAKEELLKLR